MAEAQIARRAAFDQVRYAQLWEDADVLLAALGPQRGATLLSICSAGDNALALLTADPARVVAIDLSPAQLACLRIRMAAFRLLDHDTLLELFGSRPSARRAELLDRTARGLDAGDQAFWAARREAVVRHGLGGVGKFERYFRIFRTWLLPLVHGRRTVAAVFEPRSRAERAAFLERRWVTWRWRALLRGFFSNWVMGRLGRDPAFFAHVDGSLADHVARRLRHAAVDLEPAGNPYLHWILTGTHGAALPLAWRPEQFDVIRDRLDRLELRQGSLEAFVAAGERADGFNLSDVFEYMDETAFEAAYGALLEAATPGGRLVYWNMMVRRRAPAGLAHRVRRLGEAEAAGKAADKAFFYADFVVEQVI